MLVVPCELDRNSWGTDPFQIGGSELTVLQIEPQAASCRQFQQHEDSGHRPPHGPDCGMPFPHIVERGGHKEIGIGPARSCDMTCDFEAVPLVSDLLRGEEPHQIGSEPGTDLLDLSSRQWAREQHPKEATDEMDQARARLFRQRTACSCRRHTGSTSV